MEKSNKSKLKKIAAAGIIAGTVLSATACALKTPEEPSTPIEETPEWFDYSKYGTNDTVNTNLVNPEYFSSVYYKKCSNWYDTTESTFKDTDYATKTLKINVTPDFTGAYYTGLVEVVDYYNEIFEIANMKTRFEILKTEAIDNTADIQFLMKSNLGSYLATTGYWYPDSLANVATIKVNSTYYSNLTATEIYKGYKRTLVHEIGHGIKLGHNEVDQSSIMTTSPTYETQYYPEMTPNDLRNFFFELGHIVNSQELMQNAYEYVQTKAIDFYSAMSNEVFGRYGDTKINDNTVAYYYFIFPEGKQYKTATVNLNDIYKGQYEAILTDANGKTKITTGASYIVTKQMTPANIRQEIFLDGFEYGIGQYLTSISNAWDFQLALNLGDLIGFNVRNSLGLVYPTAQERDAALTATLAATETTALTANHSHEVIAKTQKIISKKAEEAEEYSL